MATRTWFPIFAALLVLMVVSPSALAQGRDADGTRMQARPISLGTTQTDSLSPPDDRADWRLLRLDEVHQLRLDVSLSGGNSLTLTLTTSSGDPIATSRATENDAASINQRLEPGIYYISVQSSDALRYRLELR